MKKLPLYLILIYLIYSLTFFLVSPFYETPIGDDWTYAKVAKHFYETGRFQILSWYGQSLVFQIGWAFLFLLPFGFSFSALHLSNAVMGALAILFFDLLMASLQFEKRERFWGCLLLIVSPPFIFLTRTFYTDLPFLTLYLAAAWAYAKGLSRRSGPWLLIGSLFVSMALLVRQVGIFLPLLLFFVLMRDPKEFPLLWRVSVLIPFLSLGIFTLWQHAVFHGIPPANLLLSAYALRLDKILTDVLRIPFFTFLYFGYYASPLLVAGALSLSAQGAVHPKTWRLFLLAGIAFGIGILSLGLGQGLWMPDYFPKGFHLKGSGIFLYTLVTLCGLTGAAFFISIYTPSVALRVKAKETRSLLAILFLILLGSVLPPVRSGVLSVASQLLPPIYHFFSERLTLYQTLQTWQNRLPLLYHHILLALFGILCLSSILFLGIPCLMKRWKGDLSAGPMERSEKILHGASLLYLLFLLFIPVTTDRYLFPVFPSAILLSLRAARLVPSHKVLSVFLIFCVLIPSFLHTDRTIQRVGALWEGGYWLLGQGISPEKIDAGFVFNGWHLYEKRQREGFEGTDRGWRSEGWWVVDNEYRVSTDLPKGYRMLHQIPFRDLLSASQDVVTVSQRNR